MEGCNTICCSFSKRRGLARAAQSAAEGAERNKEQTAAQMLQGRHYNSVIPSLRAVTKPAYIRQWTRDRRWPLLFCPTKRVTDTDIATRHCWRHRHRHRDPTLLASQTPTSRPDTVDVTDTDIATRHCWRHRHRHRGPHVRHPDWTSSCCCGSPNSSPSCI